MKAAASVTVTTIRAESWIAISCDTALDKRGYQAVHSRFHVENVRIAIVTVHPGLRLPSSSSAPWAVALRPRSASAAGHLRPN